MEIVFNKDLKADLSIDDKQQVRQILHKGEYYLLENNSARLAASEYFQKLAEIYQLPAEQLKNMHQQVSFLDPIEQGIEYRQSEEKNFFDSTTIGYFQTIYNVPVWRTGMSVTIKQNPNRVVLSSNNSRDDIQLKLPSQQSIEKWRDMLLHYAIPYKTQGFALQKTEFIAHGEFVHEILGLKTKTSRGKKMETEGREFPQLIRGRFYVYKYDAKNRQELPEQDKNKTDSIDVENFHPTLPLPPVSGKIKDGNYYLVAEITFSLYTPQFGHLNWLALVEVETDSILYFRALVDGISGKVFEHDPITTTGDLTNTSNQSNAVLENASFYISRNLSNLDGPISGTQHLRGTFININDVDTPSIAPPTKPSGTNFDFDVRTNDFAAVCAYYHANQLFDLVADLGFSVSTYFGGTTFPINIDHRDHYGTTTGNEINAFCSGNGAGGIGTVGFMLSDLTDTTNPIGRAVDKWVFWHEIGGHGTLWNHVDSANFGFAHSAGDGLAALQNDADSALRGLSERFRYSPFRPISTSLPERRFDRDVATGWG